MRKNDRSIIPLENNGCIFFLFGGAFLFCVLLPVGTDPPLIAAAPTLLFPVKILCLLTELTALPIRKI